MASEIGCTLSINDEPHSLDIQEDQKEGECRVTRTIVDERHSSDIQPDHLE